MSGPRPGRAAGVSGSGPGSTGESRVTVLLAVAVNAFIAVAKAAGGLLCGSSVLLSEAAHSVADTLNEGFLLLALRRGARPADEQHPFGHGKARFFWSLLAAFGIFVAGGMFSFFQGYEQLTSPAHEVSYGPLYAILGISFVAEGVSWRKAVAQVRAEARAARQDTWDYLAETDDPTVLAVAGEDTAALIGLVIAALGLALDEATGSKVWEGLASLAIGVLLVGVALQLGRKNGSLLIGEAATPRTRAALRAALCGQPGVDDVTDLRTMRTGTRQLLLAARIRFAADLGRADVDEVTARLERDLRERFPEIDQVFLAPALEAPRPEAGHR